MGFFTVRFIEAATPKEAADKAIEQVREDVKGLHRPNHPWRITAEEVQEDAEAFAKYAPGLGFTWYPENDSPKDSADE